MTLDLIQTDYSEFAELVKKNNISRSNGIPPKACVITFGCQQNEADSEIIKGIAQEMGYRISDDYQECDLIIVNTCAIRAHAEMKALSLLGNFKSVKKKNPELVVGICGCMCAEPGVVDLLKKDFHYVSFTVEPNMLYRIPEMVFKAQETHKRGFIIGEDKGQIVEGVGFYYVRLQQFLLLLYSTLRKRARTQQGFFGNY